jgi:glycosyltransferase involved in cell wall biosynthesis
VEIHSALLASRLSGASLAVFRHFLRPYSKPTRWVLNQSKARIFAVSEPVKRLLEENGLRPEQLSVLDNPFFLASYTPSPELRETRHRELALPVNAVCLGYVGAISRSKGVFLLQEALARLSQKITMIWVGQGADEARLRLRVSNAQISNPAIRHHFTGWLSDPATIYGAIDIAILPSLSGEGAPRVIVEAQAMHCAVVAAAQPGVLDVLAPEWQPYVFPAGDAVALARNLEQLLSEPQERRKVLAESARAWVEKRFSAGIVGAKFLKDLSGS